jgi:hypothetical protein
MFFIPSKFFLIVCCIGIFTMLIVKRLELYTWFTWCVYYIYTLVGIREDFYTEIYEQILLYEWVSEWVIVV